MPSSWQGTVSDLLNAPQLTSAGKLDLLLRTPYLLPEEVTARLCLWMMARMRGMSEASGIFLEPLYFEMKAVLARDQLQSFLLHDRLVLLQTHTNRQEIGEYGPVLVEAYKECATWWDYGSGAYRALNIVRRVLGNEGWDEEAKAELLRIIAVRN